MLSEHLPRDDEIWEELTKSEKDRAAWKNMYKASKRKAKAKKGSFRPGPIWRRPWRTEAGVLGRPPGQKIDQSNQAGSRPG